MRAADATPGRGEFWILKIAQETNRHAVHALPSVAGDRERWDARHEAKDFLVFAHSTGCDLERFEHFMYHFFGPRRG